MISCFFNVIQVSFAVVTAKNKKNKSFSVTTAKLDNNKNAYFIYRVPRYGLKGKQLLKTQGKYYFVDNGLKNILSGFSSYDTGSSYENIVYMELLRRGYEVYVGKYNDLEIDFVAVSPNERIYYQVTRSLLSEDVETRETRSLLAINDNYKKVILTMDVAYNKTIEGIKVKNIVDFLLED